MSDKSASDIEKSAGSVEPVVTLDKGLAGTKEVIATIKSANGREINITGDVDQAMNLANEVGDMQYDAVADRKLLWKIDMFLLPLIGLVYALQFNDKVTSSNAAIMGLREHYNMHGDMYSWVGSSFYLGYLFFEFPANALLQRFPVAKTAGLFIMFWGVILCLQSCAQTYGGFVTLRVVLGMLESSVTPAMVIITGQWYKKEEQFLRTTIWFACNGIGIILAGGVSYGLAKRDGIYSMPAWKLIFVINGVMTIFIGILFIFYIPDRPDKAWFLNEKEKKMVILRIRQNQQGFGNPHWKWYQFKEALCDIQTWIFFLYGLASDIPNGSLTNFSAILLSEDFGYGDQMSLLMNMPCGAVEFAGCILCACTSFSRLGVSFITSIICLVFACVLAFSTNNTAALAAYYIFSISATPMICILSLCESNTAGHTKKITMNAIFLIGYCAGNLIGPQTFLDSEAPGYKSGKITIVITMSISALLVVWNYVVYWMRNRKRDKLAAEHPEDMPKIQNIEFADLTDMENPYFRYEL